MKFLAGIAIFCVCTVGASAFAAEELDAQMQKQLDLLEAKAKAIGVVEAARGTALNTGVTATAQQAGKLLATAVASTEPVSRPVLSSTVEAADVHPSAEVHPSEAHLTTESRPVVTALGEANQNAFHAAEANHNAPHAAEANQNAPQSTGAPVTAKPDEKEIPVLTKFEKKVDADTTPTSTRLLATFGIVIAILSGSVFFLKRYSGGKIAKSKHTQIQVTAQHYLGPKKSLAIIRVAGESILIGVTDQSISMIKQLHILDEDLGEEEITEDFKARLERSAQSESSKPQIAPSPARAALASSKQASKATPASTGSGAPFVKSAARQDAKPLNARPVYETEENALNEHEEFMMRGIRDIVSDRLRNRRSV